MDASAVKQAEADAADGLAFAAATAILRFNLGMLVVLGGSCVAGIALRLIGVI